MNRAALLSSVLSAIGAFALGWLARDARPEGFAVLTKIEPVEKGVSSPVQTAARSPAREESATLAGARLVTSISELAARDFPAALARLEAAKDPAERRALLKGLFAWLAKNRPPEEALRLALEQEEIFQHTALTAMVQEWTGYSGPLDQSERGFIVDASRSLFNTESTSPALAAAWMAAFSNHDSRAAIAASYASAFLTQTPDRLLPLAESFTPWERERFLEDLATNWFFGKEPEQLRKWMETHREEIPPAARQRALEQWAGDAPEAARAELEAATDPARRAELLPAVAGAMGRMDTAAAVAWADSLSNPVERDAAHEAIYDAVPRGIGVMLGPQGGFVSIRELIPGGAAERAGLLPGDRLVEVTGPGGDAASLYGTGLREAIENLRGNEGDTAQIRVLRTDAAGVTTEHVLPITRRQLVMKTE